jgi:broad specificity phosphatase PhoE
MRLSGRRNRREEQVETHVYLVRHGETTWNRERRFQGHQDVPLSPAGLIQAERLAQSLKTEVFDAVYSSDLQRAARTAELIARQHDLPVVTLKDLRERSMGEWEGLTQEEVAARFPDWRQRIAEGRHGAESFAELQERMMDQLEDLVRLHRGGRILAVSHGGSINAVLDRVSQGRYGPGMSRLQNTSLTHLVFDHGKDEWRVEKVNITEHLAV